MLPHPQLSPSLLTPSNTVISHLISLSFALLPQPSSSAPPPGSSSSPTPSQLRLKPGVLVEGGGGGGKKKKTLGCGTVKPGMLSRQGRFLVSSSGETFFAPPRPALERATPQQHQHSHQRCRRPTPGGAAGSGSPEFTSEVPGV